MPNKPEQIPLHLDGDAAPVLPSRRSNLRIGGYLANFGPITESNWGRAKQHADFLDIKQAQDEPLSEEQLQINREGLALVHQRLAELGLRETDETDLE